MVLPSYQAKASGAQLDLEGCAAACHAAGLPVFGVDDGTNCFCGEEQDLGTANAKAREAAKNACKGTLCRGNPKETQCGGPGMLLAISYSCGDKLRQTP